MINAVHAVTKWWQLLVGCTLMKLVIMKSNLIIQNYYKICVLLLRFLEKSKNYEVPNLANKVDGSTLRFVF